MRNSNTRVYNVRSDALASGIVKGVCILSRSAFGKTLQSRGSIGLGNGGTSSDPVVGLDVFNLVGAVDVHDHGVIGVEGHGTPGVHLEGHDLGGEVTAAETALVQVALLDGERKG